MPDASVLFQTDGPVCTILLNRPACRNAVDGPTAAALLDAFERFAADDALRTMRCGWRCWAARAAISAPGRTWPPSAIPRAATR